MFVATGTTTSSGIRSNAGHGRALLVIPRLVVVPVAKQGDGGVSVLHHTGTRTNLHYCQAIAPIMLFGKQRGDYSEQRPAMVVHSYSFHTEAPAAL